MEHMSQDDFPSILKAARKKKRLAMFEVSARTDIFLPIYKLIENGRIVPDREKLEALCAFFDLKLDNDPKLDDDPELDD